MSDKIDPAVIAEQTGLTEHEVRLVLAHLVPTWLFARYIDDDWDSCDYLTLRHDQTATERDR